MKKSVLVLFLLLPLAGCAHQQNGYVGGGGGGFFANDCLSSYDCYDGYYRQGYSYGYAVQPSSPARARVAKVERRTSTRVVTRSAAAPSAVNRSAPALSSPHSAGARSAPAAVSRAGGHR